MNRIMSSETATIVTVGLTLVSWSTSCSLDGMAARITAAAAGTFFSLSIYLISRTLREALNE